MTTVLSYHTSGGEEGRCDARCHNAVSPDCDCICGGANHGVGTQQAIENTRLMAEQMIADFAHKHDITTGDLEASVPDHVYQTEMETLLAQTTAGTRKAQASRQTTRRQPGQCRYQQASMWDAA
jgi:hypothetical protein